MIALGTAFHHNTPFQWDTRNVRNKHPSNLPSHLRPSSIFHHLAQYSPYFQGGEYPPVPGSCHIDQVSILQRHTSRYPTSGATHVLKSSIHRLQDAIHAKGRSSELHWLTRYKYKLKSDNLVPFGEKEAYTSGALAFNRYKDLTERHGVFVRASSRPRVVQTAKLWMKGFSKHLKSGHIEPPLIISDAPHSNDTLANSRCRNHVSLPREWDWAKHFTPAIIARLQHHMADYQIKPLDIIVLFSMCAFQSVADGAMSRFCSIFTAEEFLDYEYFNDLEKYYNYGYGNPLGPIQGVGYVNELIARLTGQQVEDCTQTNSTLDRDERTFPLDRGVYADFSHDNTMAAIVSAMGLFDSTDSRELPTDHRNSSRSWFFGRIAPFGGRLVFERLSCLDASGSTGKRVRIIANDALQKPSHCDFDDDYTCSVDDFVKVQRFARVDGQLKWAECFAGERGAREQ